MEEEINLISEEIVADVEAETTQKEEITEDHRTPLEKHLNYDPKTQDDHAFVVEEIGADDDGW